MKNKRIESSFNNIDIDKFTDKRILDSIIKYNNTDKFADVFGDKNIDKNKKFWLGAAAACVCFALITGIIYYQGSAVPDNTFTVTANAAEIKEGLEIDLGDFDLTSDCSSIMGSKVMDDDGNQKTVIHGFYIAECIEFPIMCEGDCIKSITYSLPNVKIEDIDLTCQGFPINGTEFDPPANTDPSIYFILHPNFAKKTTNNGIPNDSHSIFYITDSTVATEYTINYDDQPTIDEFGAGSVMTMNENNVLSDRSKIAPVMLFFSKHRGITEDERSEINRLGKEHYDEYAKKVLKETFDQYKSNLEIDITAEFTNGNVKTKTLLLEATMIYPDDEQPYIRVTGSLSSEK